LEYPDEDSPPPKMPPPFRFHVPRVEDDQEELLPKLDEPRDPPPPYLPATAAESPTKAVNKKKTTIMLRIRKTRFLIIRISIAPSD